MQRRFIFYKQFLVLFILFSLSNSTLAQTKKTVASNQTKPAAAKCASAWTGTIRYSKTFEQNENKTTPLVSGRGEQKRNVQLKSEYTASSVVREEPGKPGSSIGQASMESVFTHNENTVVEEKNSCDQGKTWKTMRGVFERRSQTQGQGKGDANISVGVNEDGTYTVGIGLPQISGKTTGSDSSTYSGQCKPKEGHNTNFQPFSTTIDGNSFMTDGSHRIDPADPNRLSGSYSKSFSGMTETISWSLQRCGASLRITDIEFEQMKFPNWNEWVKVDEQTATIDGNLIKIKAKVLNITDQTKFADVRFKETYKGDKWDGAKPDAELKDNLISVRVDAGEEAEVEMLWDSSGYAWYDDGRPRLVQRIKAQLEENLKKVDEMTKNIKVAPKPVVLVHGLWSNAEAWSTWQNLLTLSHSYDWKAFAVGKKPEKGIMNTGGEFLSTTPTNSIAQNAKELEKYIEYAQRDRNAWHVNIVAHSMGGLISRYYIDRLMPMNYKDGRPQVSHLIMLGTPNMGSPCADIMDTAFRQVGKNVEALRELKPSVVGEFNKQITNRKGVKFSALAGKFLPVVCGEYGWNDSVVFLPSAKWQIKDIGESDRIHTDLTGTRDFNDFVKPRLIVGPKGNHNPDVSHLLDQKSGQNYREINDVMFINASRGPNVSNEEFVETSRTTDVLFAKAVKLAPKQSVEIEIPVEQANNLGITFMADTQTSATLFDEKGVIVGKNLAKTPESSSWVRSIFVDKPTAKTTWKLKLENTSDKEFEAILATWKDAVK